MIPIKRGDNEPPVYPWGPVKVFLAGSISGCHDWQSRVIDILQTHAKDDQFIVYNPRCDSFDMSSRLETERQIAWEFERLEAMDIFSIYFAESETSVSPISLYELGRNICRMQMRFPNDWQNRIIIDVEAGYPREIDVVEQVYLATRGQVCVNTRANENSHAERIRWAVFWIRNRNQENWDAMKGENQ